MSQYLSGVWKGWDESVDAGADIDDKVFADKIFEADKNFADKIFEANNLADNGNTGVGIALVSLSLSSQDKEPK